MKSRLLVLLLALMLVLLCSCEHTHTFSGSYSSDETNHWQECECGEKNGLEEHQWNNGAVTLWPTADSEGEMTYTCKVCRAKKTEKIDKLGADHAHEYNIAKYDDTYHWNECECGEKQGQAEHSWGDGELIKAPSETEEGKMKYECLVCEYEYEETLPCVEPEDTDSLTVEEFNAQPITRGNGWDEMPTKRIKIYIKILMDKGTKITFTGDTSVYRWSVVETTNKDTPSSGTFKDSKWNTDPAWTGTKSTEYVTYVYDSAYLILTVSLISNAEFTDSDIGDLHSMFTVEGKKTTISTDDVIHENNPWLDEDMVSINHRGWYEAPENTLSAYRESKEHGFKYVECDVLFTKDGVPVLLHDATIDRTSNGSGNISDLTYAELLQYDFSYDDNDATQDFSAYRGEKIPTFAEFIALCKELELHPYIEIKGTISNEQAQLLVTIVSDAGMLDSVSWLSFSGDALAKIVSIDDTARVVWVMTDTNATKIAANNIPFAQTKLMTGKSEVVFDLWYSLATQDVVDLLTEYNIPLEVWTVNDANTILNLHPYVSGVTSDKCNAKDILSEAGKLN